MGPLARPAPPVPRRLIRRTDRVSLAVLVHHVVEAIRDAPLPQSHLPKPPPCRMIRRTGRVSLVVLALATIMIIGGIAVGAFGVTIVISAVRDGNLGLAPLCA